VVTGEPFFPFGLLSAPTNFCNLCFTFMILPRYTSGFCQSWALFFFSGINPCIVSDEKLEEQNAKQSGSSWLQENSHGCVVKGFESRNEFHVVGVLHFRVIRNTLLCVAESVLDLARVYATGRAVHGSTEFSLKHCSQ